MSGVSLPVNRPTGRAIVVGSAGCRGAAVQTLRGLGYQTIEAENPYSAAAELARRSMTYRSMILCLNSLYREELSFIASIKHRYPHIDIWLSQTDGRAAALAEALRLGADGLLSDDGPHRFAMTDGSALVGEKAAGSGVSVTVTKAGGRPEGADAPRPMVKVFAEAPIADPVLTADELRALLQEPARQEPHEK
jgi:DNA-binding NarL/FixJ family response regulator